MTSTTIRWVAIRVQVSEEGAKAAQILGELSAPDRDSAFNKAALIYGPRNLSVISKLSWDMSMEERARLERRNRATNGQLGRRPERKPAMKRKV